MNLKNVVVSIVALFLVAACSPPKKEARRLYNPDFEPQNCTNAMPNWGNNAKTTNSREDSVTTSDFFAKPYDRADLNAILDASPMETARYVGLLGVGLYKVARVPDQRNPKPCRLFAFLSLASEFHHDVWAANGGSNPAEGYLAGLYFEDCSSCPDKSVYSPTILVDDSTGRWTLVHELTHHNFNKERKRRDDYLSNQTLIALASASAKGYEQTVSDLTTLNAASSYLDQTARYLYRIMVQSSFEEIATEGLLLQEYAAGRLDYVFAEDAKNAAWYMEYGRERGLKRFESIDKAASDLISRARANGNETAATKATETKKFIEGIREETRKMVAQGNSDASRLTLAGLFDSSEFTPTIEDVSKAEEHLENHYPELKELEPILSVF